jgi:hypothetical protein
MKVVAAAGRGPGRVAVSPRAIAVARCCAPPHRRARIAARVACGHTRDQQCALHAIPSQLSISVSMPAAPSAPSHAPSATASVTPPSVAAP